MATTKYFVAAGTLVAILQPLGAEPEVRATTKDATFDEGWSLGGDNLLLRKGRFLIYVAKEFVELREVEDAPEATEATAPATPAPKPAPARTPRIACLRRSELPPLPEGGCVKCSGTRTYKGYGGRAVACLACVKRPGVWEGTRILDDEPAEAASANG